MAAPASHVQGETRRFTAPCARGLEPVLAAELQELGLEQVRALTGAVAFTGPLEHGYRALLWSRVASRVLLQVGQGPARDAQQLYRTVRQVPWVRHLSPHHTLAVDFVGRNDELRHSGFAARRTKDAICDALRDETGRRPSIDLKDPDLRVHVYLFRDRCRISLDLAGPPLHERSAGVFGGAAPLKETLAAAILYEAGWPAAARAGTPLVDPMCGSGTFLREAVAMAAGLAPGLARERWGFHGWQGHDQQLWGRLVGRARAHPPRPVPPVFGYDSDRDALETAQRGLRGLGLDDTVRFAQAPLAVAEPPTEQPGLVVTNPPYGERLLSRAEAENLMGTLGDVLRRRFLGWTAWVLAGSPRLAKRIGLKPSQKIPMWNGRIECRLLEVPISSEPVSRDA